MSNVSLNSNPNNHINALMNAVSGAGGKMESAESSLMAAFNSGKESEIGKAQIEYQKQQRIYELLTTFIKNMHEMLMSVIRMLRVQ